MLQGSQTVEIEEWLATEALADPDIVLLFDQLCLRLREFGVPLDRAKLSWQTLHPLFRAEQILWRTGEAAQLVRLAHSSEGLAEAYLKSPFRHVLQSGLAELRRRLVGRDTPLDFEVLREFAAQGFTDYLLTATRFRIATATYHGGSETGLMASWTTKRPGGFGDADLDTLRRVQTALAIPCRAAIQQRLMTNLGDAYLGPTACRKVLDGDIRLGDGARIEAVIWFSDLRGSTRLSSVMPPADYLALVNRYYECTAQAVIDERGEVLNFVGDGVLSIFPVLDDGASAAAARAEAAVRRALASHKCMRCEPSFTFGIGLTLGEVMFGNIGVPSRLSFSAMGRNVNQVQRVEKATAKLGCRVLATAAFVDVAHGHWRPAGTLNAPEFDGEVALFSMTEAGMPAADKVAQKAH